MDDFQAYRELIWQTFNMSEADLSILRAAVSKAPAPAKTGARTFGKRQQEQHLATMAGSANERLWRELEQRGWLMQVAVPGLTEEPPVGVKPASVFAVLPEGQAPIAALLAERDRQKSIFTSKMTSIHNEKCLPFVAEMATAVKHHGGSGVDIATLGALMLKAVLQVAAVKGQEEKVLDDIVRMTREVLAKERQRESTS